MPTRIDGPDVLEKLASMRPDAESVDQAWNQSRREAALRRALAAEAPERGARAARPVWRGGASRWIGAGVAVAAVGAAVLLLVPGILDPTPVPATPATPVASPPPVSETAEPDPTIEPTPEPEPGEDLAGLTVSTAGWKTFSSPEYPVTFSYPPDWKISYSKQSAAVAKADQLTPAGIVDGCGVGGCAVHLRPPGQDDEGTHVVLMRTGFQGEMFSGPYPGAWLLTTVPDLQVWTSADPTAPSATATVITRSDAGFTVGGTPEDFGPPYDYMLSTADFTQTLAMGESNPLAERPEASFTFEANGGVPEDEVNTVVTILTSVRVNPDFSPTQPARDSSGRPKFWMRSMDAPSLGLDSSGWKTFDVPDGNVRVRVPPKWKARDYGDGIVHFSAPSGYVIVALTNGTAQIGCRGVTEWVPAERLGTLPGLTAPAADGVVRPIELWWEDATWHPTEVRLSQVSRSDENLLCSQSAIDYGGELPVYLGSADNSKNPTPAELDQAVAILTSVQRLN